jgi:hypothetical protein
MLVPYRNTNRRNDNTIYFFDGVSIPEGFIKLQTIFLVKKCKEGEQDYTVLGSGRPTHFKFASESGRQHFFGREVTRKTQHVASVTNYDCLVASGRTDYKISKVSPTEEVQTDGVIGEEND